MFRTAVLRSASQAARAVARPAMRRSAVLAAPRVSAVAVPKIQSFQGVRFYSAGGALNKEEVEGRIISLLQGFDKVSFEVSGLSSPSLTSPTTSASTRSTPSRSSWPSRRSSASRSPTRTPTPSTPSTRPSSTS
ncbi:hypothetical protein ACJ41O_014871 [Fusarium nematophilum]